jgi:SAM-dependent methyltransferase
LAEFDKLASIYDATRSLPEDVMEAVVREIAKALQKYESKSLIDVGVGTGRFALPISRSGFNVVGIDISREMLKIARGKRLDNLLLADGRTCPFADKSFDAAMTIHILHLTTGWRAVLREVSRLTKHVLISSGADGDGLNMRLKYLELRREMDLSFSERGLENGESTLAKKILKPDEVVVASEKKESINADEELEYFQNRGSAITLDTPEDAHRRIMDALRSSYAGTTIQRTRKELVYIWRIETLQRQATQLGATKPE